MFKRGAAFDQMKITSMARAAIWQTSGIMLYSTTSNRNHINVAPTRTPADKFLSFHSKTSATARHKQLGSWVNRPWRKSHWCRWRSLIFPRKNRESSVPLPPPRSLWIDLCLWPPSRPLPWSLGKFGCMSIRVQGRWADILVDLIGLLQKARLYKQPKC